MRLSVTLLLVAAWTALSSPAPAQSTPNRVYVLIDGPREATLERLDHDRWVTACAAPCDRPFSASATYRIAGDGMHDSEPFMLQGKSGSTVTLQVHEAKHRTGTLLTEGGVIVTLLGGLTLVGGIAGSCSDGSCNNYSWLTYTGGALAVVGVVAIVSGIVLLAEGAHASVVQSVVREPVAVQRSAAFSPGFRADARASSPRGDLRERVPCDPQGLVNVTPATAPLLTFSF